MQRYNANRQPRQPFYIYIPAHARAGVYILQKGWQVGEVGGPLRGTSTNIRKKVVVEVVVTK